MSKTLNIGDPIPQLTLKDQDGKEVNLSELRGHPVVIYFYPKDDTPGCTTEACSFRDQYEDFENAGAEVIGISADSVSSHKRFATKYRLNFRLLSDKGRKAEKAFGVERNLLGLIGGRVTFVFDAKGHLIKEFNSARNFLAHITESLDALNAIR
ncbi:peroxiredoxin [Marinoscillum sp. MHG1-6]|uniref:peroxiredoxin n=1 Tax=Marinoscillum sp. MHG1-6 TaxID=2959627 RepID=UPI0021576617|nr:peroxiredoxin [Marinoscillum sp. MHG1-6]